jgi:hypothetical protein
MRRARVGRGALPPSARLEVLAMATRQPARDHGSAPRWSLDDLVAALAQGRPWTMRRSSLWRLWDDADRKPHRRVDGRNSHAPACEATAHDMCALSLNALHCFAQDRVVMCRDAKTGRQMLQRPYPTPPMAPGQPEKRAHEDLRHGVRALSASCVVATGQVVWHLGQTRPSEDCATHLATVVQHRPDRQRYDWVVEHLQTPWRLAVCRLVAPWCPVPCVAKDLHRGGPRRAFLSDPTPKHVWHLTPQHGSGLNQVAWWLSVVARRFLKRGDVDSAHDLATRL